MFYLEGKIRGIKKIFKYLKERQDRNIVRLIENIKQGYE